MASVERKRKIQIKHPKFSDQPGCVQLKKSGFASNNEMHAYRPLGLDYCGFHKPRVPQGPDIKKISHGIAAMMHIVPLGRPKAAGS